MQGSSERRATKLAQRRGKTFTARNTRPWLKVDKNAPGPARRGGQAASWMRRLPKSCSTEGAKRGRGTGRITPTFSKPFKEEKKKEGNESPRASRLNREEVADDHDQGKPSLVSKNSRLPKETYERRYGAADQVGSGLQGTFAEWSNDQVESRLLTTNAWILSRHLEQGEQEPGAGPRGLGKAEGRGEKKKKSSFLVLVVPNERKQGRQGAGTTKGDRTPCRAYQSGRKKRRRERT